jgi:hypothetical protein
MTPELFPHKRAATLAGGPALATMLIDTEEDFDWTQPVENTAHSTDYLRHIADLQHVLAAYGVQPTYLLTYPVLTDETIIRNLQRAVEGGQCMVGLQLHPWVTPPFAGTSTTRHSFSGNLAPDIEEAKLEQLMAQFIRCFGMPPRIFRAGRYGLGTHTAFLLEAYGFDIDTSLAPRTSMVHEGGPDYSDYDYKPFWFGAQRDVLELPLCRSVVGWGGDAGAALYRNLSQTETPHHVYTSLLAGSGYAERITLSPEGNDIRAMCRLVHRLRERGQKIFPLSFHSSSLWPGRNPYVQSRADLHWFYDRLSAILSHLADDIGCRFAAAAEIPALLAPPSRPDASCLNRSRLDTSYRNTP